jgi:hypothetical protein
MRIAEIFRLGKEERDGHGGGWGGHGDGGGWGRNASWSGWGGHGGGGGWGR